ncbi:hypothetical protein AB0I81_27915 [Nonomuraea sp. NPDC050404]|uniref:hypothetical protein n=1 Tax=Nonomuraea sp. NPDC050404 TaxID=3155783 RepID=UPI0033D2F4E7
MGTQPPPGWPGLQAERDAVTYDAKKIETIAGELRDALKPLETMSYGNPGSIHDFNAAGYTIQTFTDHLKTVERWGGGHDFAAQLMGSHKSLHEIYQEVVTKLNIAISLVDAGAGNYKVTDTANLGGS